MIDLCCGRGGWTTGFIAEGYVVMGVDKEEQPSYPGSFLRADVRDLVEFLSTVHGTPWLMTFKSAAVIMASPPCEEFSRHGMPWTKKWNPKEPDTSIAGACFNIARLAGRPIVLENVRAAQKWLGKAEGNSGPFYLWGDVPVPVPDFARILKKDVSHRQPALRAVIPLELAKYMARHFKRRLAQERRGLDGCDVLRSIVG